MMNKNNPIVRFFKGKNLKYGANSFILIAVVIALAVVLNLLVGMTGLQLDLSPEKLFSIGDVTKKIVSGMTKDVVIYGLFDDGTITSGSEYSEVTQLLDQYKKYPKVTIVYVDPDKNPGIIKELDPDNLKELAKNDFVVKSGNKMKKLSYYDIFQTEFDQQSFEQYKTGSNAEQAFTGAIKYVTADKTPVIYFTEGHDENKLESDYTTVKSYLERNNYDVKTINLLSLEKIPEDTEILVVASPKKDISVDERDKIEAYFKTGGKALLMFDSLETGALLTEFQKLLLTYNLALNNDMVRENDANRHVPNVDTDLVPIVLNNSINSALDPSNFVMIMPKSRSIQILKNVKEYITTTSLMETSNQAVGEPIITAGGNTGNGPLTLAAAVEYKGGSKPVKLLVMGNGSFMTDDAINTYQQYSINGLYFFINSLSWLQDKQEETLIAPKLYNNPQISITAAQATITGLSLVIVLPLVILGAGLFVFLRRRHL
ncbi:MAG: GldG family protein [Clostridiales bacterium]|nr:GldG family protein [Clostridiales bacterium]